MEALSFVSTSAEHRRRVAMRNGRIESVRVPARTLASLIEELDLFDVGWMSVDVEGAELEVLKEALDRFRPRLLLIEDNSAGRNRSVVNFLQSVGYPSEMSIGCNNLYVRND